ncbi:MAG: hypothetical protein FIA97_02405 [Methylococcaceae bacterium]|nr:hypothetical protein [Methylococcaceae bacterium]
MKPTFSILAPGLALALTVADLAGAAPVGGKIAADLDAALTALPAGQTMTVIVRLVDQANLAPYRRLRLRFDRLRQVGIALRNKADVSQRAMQTLLGTRQGQGRVSRFKSFWVFNGLSVTASADVIRELASRSDVESITSDTVDIVPTAGPPEPNLTAIGAPDVWNLGFTGQGVVVANLDSGVDNSHPDLVGRWRGGSNSWYDPYAQHTTPYDASGHGTWTMGLMVGGDAVGTSIGVAPGARWIAAKIFKDNGTATATGIHQAFQWLLDPDGNPATADAPDVVNNSWSYGSPGCNLAFQSDLQALVSAGIVPVFAAGNYGPGPGSSVSPANYPEALSVGAVDNADQLYAYSSVGPSACGASRFPTVVAPGVYTLTTTLFGMYTNSAEGTSLSAPHVTGALALLLSAFPNLTADQQRQALTSSAVDLGDPGPDDIYGYGRINLAAAYDWTALNIGNQPPVDTLGPVASGVAASPNPNNGTLGFAVGTPAVRLSASLTDPSSNGLQSNINAAEVFVDTVGINGAGIAAIAADGVFDSPTESVVADIALTAIAQLAEGSHTLYLRGRDAAGNWGATASTVLIIDKTGPTVTNVAATPTNSTITLLANATDPSPGTIAGAEWFEGTDPGVGMGSPVSVSGSNLKATINVAAWPIGSHTLFVRARDLAGNWGSPVSTTVVIPPPNTLFFDSFESSNLSAWNGGVVGTRLSVNATAKMTTAGSYGLQATLGSGTSPSYVADLTPALESSYHARFYFNPHGANPGSGQVTLLSGLNSVGTTLFQVQFQRVGSTYQVRGVVTRAGGTSTTNWFNITNNTAHYVEIAWQSAASASFQLYVDGSLKQSLSALNTGSNTLDAIRMGLVGGLVNSASGSVYLDAFASTRNTVIGP